MVHVGERELLLKQESVKYLYIGVKIDKTLPESYILKVWDEAVWLNLLLSGELEHIFHVVPGRCFTSLLFCPIWTIVQLSGTPYQQSWTDAELYALRMILRKFPQLLKYVPYNDTNAVSLTIYHPHQLSLVVHLVYVHDERWCPLFINSTFLFHSLMLVFLPVTN